MSPQDHHTKRDGETMEALGLFMSILSVPVLIGTLSANTGVEMAVNLTAALVLAAIGAAFFLRGRKYKKDAGQ